MMLFALLNFAAGFTVLLFACEELGEKRRWLPQPSVWIYAAMALGGVMVAVHGLTGTHHPTEVFFNVVVAMHFARKMWQAHQKRQAEQTETAAPPENPPPAPPKTKPAKPNRRTRRKRRR